MHDLFVLRISVHRIHRDGNVSSDKPQEEQRQNVAVHHFDLLDMSHTTRIGHFLPPVRVPKSAGEVFQQTVRELLLTVFCCARVDNCEHALYLMDMRESLL